MNISKVVLWLCGGLLLVMFLFGVRQALKIAAVTKGVSYESVPFNRNLQEPDLKFLFLGDSTAVGTGAANNQQSVAGYFAQDFQYAQVTNIGQNGKRIHELLAEIKDRTFDRYDLVVIQIGANDILKLTPYKNIEQDLSEIIQKAKTLGRHVVILHSGNVGIAPIFVWPVNQIMTERSRKVRDIYIRQAQELGVMYVDLFSERKDDLFLKDIAKYYSPDYLHPSGDGYRWWYERIRQTMQKAGVMLIQKTHEEPTI